MMAAFSTEDACCICLEHNVECLTEYKEEEEISQFLKKVEIAFSAFCAPQNPENRKRVLKICNSCLKSVDILLPFKEKFKATDENWENILSKPGMKILETCRFCADTYPNILRIFGAESRRMDLEEKINNCISPLKVTKGDKLPLNICKECLEIIKISSELHTKHQPIIKKLQESPCPSCGKIFPDKKTLNNHNCPKSESYKPPVRYSTLKINNNITMCELCGFQLKKSELKLHICSIIICKICYKSVSSKSDLETHFAQQHDGKMLCKVLRCYDYFDNDKEWRNHAINIHKKNHLKRTICDLCGVEVNYYKIKEHINYVHEKNAYKYNCGHCEKGFKERSKITRHMLVHFNIRNYHCKHCPSKFFCKAHLDLHLNLHSKIYFPCHICDKKFRIEVNLRAHIDNVHTSTLMYHCSICNVGFKSLKLIREHLKKQCKDGTYEMTSEFQCEICCNYFKNRTKFVWHLKSKHDINKQQYDLLSIEDKEKLGNNGKLERKMTFKCKICSKLCNSQRGLNVHIKIHNKNLLFECKYCKKTFASKLQLTSHAIAHVKEIEFSCGQCEVTCSSKMKLKRHIVQCHIKNMAA